MDTELAGVVMLMDLALIFGLAVPVVLPMLCISFAGHLATFHLAREHLGMQIKYEAKPAMRYDILPSPPWQSSCASGAESPSRQQPACASGPNHQTHEP